MRWTAVLASLGVALAFTATARAQIRTVYDWQSGNSYVVTPNYGGGMHVQGYNLNTGSIWNTDIDSQGNMHGYDAGGNYWTYDRGSKTYLNAGTGRGCVGDGYARTCW